MNRRNLLKTIGTGIAGVGIMPIVSSNKKMKTKYSKLKGNINHSVSAWCYNKLSFEDLAKASKNIGLVGIDLVGSENWDILKKHDLVSTMCYGDLEGKSTRSLTNGWCDTKYHEDLISNYLRHIKLVSDAGWTNLICFSGSRRNISIIYSCSLPDTCSYNTRRINNKCTAVVVSYRERSVYIDI